MALNMFDVIDDRDLELICGAQKVPEWVTDEMDYQADQIEQQGGAGSTEASFALREGAVLLRGLG